MGIYIYIGEHREHRGYIGEYREHRVNIGEYTGYTREYRDNGKEHGNYYSVAAC